MGRVRTTGILQSEHMGRVRTTGILQSEHMGRVRTTGLLFFKDTHWLISTNVDSNNLLVNGILECCSDRVRKNEVISQIYILNKENIIEIFPS